MSKPVFISYATEDTDRVTMIRDHLEEQCIACWMAPRDIVPGKEYAGQIIEAIEAARVLLLVLSESSNQSIFVRHEVERAVAKGKVILPVRIQPVQPTRSLEFFISNYQWVDAWMQPLADRLDLLTEAIGDHLAQGDVSSATAPVVEQRDLVEIDSQTVLHNLPHQLTPFIGREQELAAIDELLAQREVRLVTILGPGGMGKTRLALAVAERIVSDPRYVHGVFFVALAPLREPQHIVYRLVDVLSLSLQSGEVDAARQQLLAYLRQRSLLLLFDNFEHLLEGAGLVAEILQTAAHVDVLVTSRERLHVPGEHLFQIQGLDHGDGDSGSAVDLFIQCARQVLPDLVFTREELDHVNTICRLVGGMPLGIELASAWIEVLSPADIASEIERSLDFLEGKRRGGAEHHASVRAVFDASWQRLAPAEQTILAQLSIFRGGFTREAAERMTGASLRQLSALASKSLIQHERARGRYTLHELLRQFAEEKLYSDPETWTQTHDRHCSYFVLWLRDQESGLKGAHYIAAIDEVELELENVRAAWNWAMTQARLEQIEHGMESLTCFYDTKTWYEEAESMLGRTISMVEKCNAASSHSILHGKLLAKRASMWYQLAIAMNRPGAIARAQDLYSESIRILKDGKSVPELGDAFTGLSVIASHQGDIDAARQLADKAVALYEQISDGWRLGNAFFRFGFRAMALGRYQEAKGFHQRGIVHCRAAGDHQGLGHNLNLLGEAHKALGELVEAQQAAQSALAVRSEANDQLGRAWSLQLLGDLSWRMGDLVQAKEQSQVSLTMFETIGLLSGQDFSLCNLGNIAYTEGDTKLAQQYFRAVLAPKLSDDSIDSDRVAEALLGMAMALKLEEKVILAAELMTLVLQHPGGWQETKDRSKYLLSEISDRFPDQATAFVRPLEVIVAEVLEQ